MLMLMEMLTSMVMLVVTIMIMILIIIEHCVRLPSLQQLTIPNPNCSCNGDFLRVNASVLQCNVFILREDKDKSQQKSLFRALASQKTFRLHLYNHAEAGASCGEDYIDDADALNIPSHLCFDDISVLTPPAVSKSHLHHQIGCHPPHHVWHCHFHQHCCQVPLVP